MANDTSTTTPPERRPASGARLPLLLAAGAFAAFGPPAAAQETAPPVFDDLRLRSIGPAVMAGRVSALEVVPGRPHEYYIGTASGGLFRTRNNGATWDALFERYTTTSIGALALAPSDPATVWVGTGEPANRQSSSFGDGVYLSFDAGESFTRVGLEESEHIGRIVVDPERPRRAFVAALGPLWRSGGDRGVFLTEDGGATWRHSLAISEDTGAVDLEMDPTNPSILYAAAYTRRRTPWGFNGGGPEGGIYRTTDGGATWSRLAGGLPEGPIGRVGLEIVESNPTVVYATVEHATESGTWRSEDRGGTWERISDLNPRPMYYSHIEVDPADPRRVYVLGAQFYLSDDGGRTFRENRDMTPTYDIGVHGDHHALWMDPANGDHLLLGGDGGVYESWDRAVSWRKVNNLPLTQYYAISLDLETPYNIYGGAQDTHSWVGPSATRNQAGILNSDWKQTNFGDGMDQAAAPGEPGLAFTSSQNGNIVRIDTANGQRMTARPFPEEDEDRYRFHWLSPMDTSPHRAGRVYFGGNRMFLSDDLGAVWRATEDLTLREDRSELPILGVLPAEGILSMHDGVSHWGTLTTLAESPLVPGLLYAGSDDGRVSRSDDDGATWVFVEDNLPTETFRATISRVTPSSHEPDRLYVAVDRHHSGDFAPLVFVSEDRGETFREIGGGLPRGWVNDLVEHPDGADLLVAGTEVGAFLSFDRGGSWMRLGGGLPHVPVDDIEIHPRDRDLVLGTHGRSIYILDDSAPLARRDPRDPAAGVELFEPRPALVYLPWKHESYEAQARYAGENPPAGALLTVFLPGSAVGDAPPAMEVRSAAGEVVARPAVEARAGFQRVVWDLAAAPEDAASSSDEPAGEDDCAVPGPRAAVGRYTVRLTAGGAEREAPLEVRLDPSVTVTEAAYAERTSFLLDIRATLVEACRAAAPFADANEDEFPESQRSALTDLRSGGGFRNPSARSRLARLYSEFTGDRVRQGTLDAPTPVHRRRFASLRSRLLAAAGLLESR